MKKYVYILTILLILICSVGCSAGDTDDGMTNYTIERDGSVKVRIREYFTESYYDVDELKNDILKEAAEYNNRHTSGAVMASKLQREGDIIDVEMKYITAQDFAEFTSEKFYAGPVEGSLASGYSLHAILTDVNDPAVTISESDIKNMSGENILITDLKERIYLPSKVLYASDNCTVDENNSIKAVDDAEGLIYVIYK